MPTILQFRRGTTAQNDNYTGSAGELTIDTEIDTIRVHDGSSIGGHSIVSIAGTQTLTNKTLVSPVITGTMTATTINAATIGNSGAAITGTIQTAAQTNITSVGTLTGLTLSGTLAGTTINAATIGNSGAAITGTIQTASQTNITGLGTVTTGTWSATTISVASGGTGVTSSTGSGSTVLSASPTFTGVPVAPTATVGTNTTQIATTAYAVAQIADYAPTKTGTGASGTWAIDISGAAASATGNAGTATTLQTARAINGVNFNGSAAITVEPYVDDDEATNATRYITFVDNSTAGYKRLNEDSTLTYNPSSGTLAATIFSGTATTARYADLAEKYVADSIYEPGTVMIFGGDNEVTESLLSYETAIAGVVSTNPAYLMNNDLNEENTVSIALVGRVPCKVMGPVTKGQVLVTSEHPGVAMAIDNTKFFPGCIIGRAMEDFNAMGIIQIIEVAVGRS